MSKPDVTALLDAAHLEDMEAQYFATEAARGAAQGAVDDGAAPDDTAPVELPGLTLATVQEAFRRIAYHKRQKERVQAEVSEAIAGLQAQIDQFLAYEAEQIAQREQSITFHKQRLIAFYRLNEPKNTKTLKLPGGTVARKDPARQWKWQDEATLLSYLQASGAPVVRTPAPPPPPPPTVDKAALKKWARVSEATGEVANPDTGEVIPGVLTEQPQPEFVVELA